MPPRGHFNFSTASAKEQQPTAAKQPQRQRWVRYRRDGSSSAAQGSAATFASAGAYRRHRDKQRPGLERDSTTTGTHNASESPEARALRSDYLRRLHALRCAFGSRSWPAGTAA